MNDSIVLNKGREKSMLRHHPWIFSGAIKSIQGNPKLGSTVDILSDNGTWYGRASYSPHSQISARIWTFDPKENPSYDFFKKKIEKSCQNRKPSISTSTDAYRLVYAESDYLPGLIVDHYPSYLVCQFLTAGTEFWKKEITQALSDLFPQYNIFERSDADIREKEGLTPTTGVLHGNMPPDFLEIRENNCRFLVDIQKGHKTGFYLDQRDNRFLLSQYSQDKSVVNCFCYSGGFGISALKGNASHVTQIDSSASILDLAKKNAELNQIDDSKTEYIEGDAFQILRKYRDQNQFFDIIILDPPKFVESNSQLDNACRGYKDINLLAFKLLKPKGLLFTFSCSGLMPLDLFQKVVADAALDAHKDAQIIERLTQGSDHPTALHFPEGTYLKGFMCQVC